MVMKYIHIQIPTKTVHDFGRSIKVLENESETTTECVLLF